MDAAGTYGGRRSSPVEAADSGRLVPLQLPRCRAEPTALTLRPKVGGHSAVMETQGPVVPTRPTDPVLIAAVQP